jgi:hypothetical protein
MERRKMFRAAQLLHFPPTTQTYHPTKQHPSQLPLPPTVIPDYNPYRCKGTPRPKTMRPLPGSSGRKQAWTWTGAVGDQVGAGASAGPCKLSINGLKAERLETVWGYRS